MTVHSVYPIPDKPGETFEPELIEHNGKWYSEYAVHEDYMWLGYCPTPRSIWQGFIHDLCHGLIMRYPLWEVLTWSIKQTIGCIARGHRGQYDRRGR